MAFVNSDRPLDLNDVDLEIYEDEAERPKKKRRKTAGDAPSSESKYHTQTLTQIGDWSFSTESEEPEKAEEDDSVYDVVSSSPRSKELRRKRASDAVKTQTPAIQRYSRRESAPSFIEPPQTPHRRLDREIPSSESPATPPSRDSTGKQSALRERSINIPISFNTTSNANPSPSKLPRLRVEDTFESEDASQPLPNPSTPSKRSSPPKLPILKVEDTFESVSQHHTPLPTLHTKRSSPAKSVRWAEADEIHQIDDSLPSTEGDVFTNPPGARPPVQLKNEIMDSEDEDESYEPSEGEISGVAKEALQQETYYGEIGLETQQLLRSRVPSTASYVEGSQILDESLPHQSIGNGNGAAASQFLSEDVAQDWEVDKTQYMESQRLATQHVRSMAARTKDSDVFLSIRPEQVSKIVDRTQNHDFRRQKIPYTVSRAWIYETAPTKMLQYMAVIGPAKRPGELEDEHGMGNAEFNSKNPNCGELAREILELYELADPLPWATIEANEWLNHPPKKPTFVRPAVLDQLMANLKPAIFCQASSILELITGSSDTQEAEEQLLNTMKQYTQIESGPETASSQLIKLEDDDEDMEDDEENRHDEDEEDDANTKDEDDEHNAPFTAKPPRNNAPISIPSSSQLNAHAHSSPAEPYPLPQPKPSPTLMEPPHSHAAQRAHPTFSQAETVDLTQTQTQTPRHHRHTSDIIFESPTRPLFSSTPMTLPPPRERASSGATSVVPYSMNSSQLLTRSQMLPESLLNDSLPGFLPCIQDSEDEDGL